MGPILLFLACLGTGIAPSLQQQLRRPVVTTSAGRIRGMIMKNWRGREFYGFQAIPYAKPPLGNLRFEKPQPIAHWNGIRDGSRKPTACLQHNPFPISIYFGKEDCLHMNIYTPQLSTDPKKLLPVVVFLYGGSFQIGFSTLLFYNPGKYMDRDTVFVMFNYRLDVLGFLSTGDKSAPGNYGLWDMVEALKFVQKNIQKFGGDPNNVTIQGISAGSIAASMLLLSNQTTGLYHRAILQSGVVDKTINQTNPLRTANRLAQIVGCPRNSTSEMVACFKKAKDIDLLKASVQLGQEPGYFTLTPNTVFLPIMDRTQDLISEPEKGLYTDGRFINRVPIIIGNMANEGIFPVLFLQMGFSQWAKTTDVAAHYTSVYLLDEKQCTQNMSRVVDRIKAEYLCDDDLRMKQKDPEKFTRLAGMVFTDLQITQSNYKFASFWARQNESTFYYVFSYVGKYSNLQMLTGKKSQDATHGDDILYMFDIKKLSGEDELFNQQLLSYWVSNFAATGDPNSGRSTATPIKWEKFEGREKSYLLIDKQFQNNTKYRERSQLLWNNILPKILTGQSLNEEETKVVPCDEYLPHRSLQSEEKL